MCSTAMVIVRNDNVDGSVYIGQLVGKGLIKGHPTCYRADSIEAMLAEIPSRFSKQKSLSIGSSSSTASSFQTPLGAGHTAREPQPLLGAAAIPSRRSRDVPGLQPATSALRQPCGPPGSHVTPDPVANGEIPRYATCCLSCSSLVTCACNVM